MAKTLTESQRRALVGSVRSRKSMRSAAQEFGVSLSTVQYWFARAGNQRLGRVNWSDRPMGVRCPANRTSNRIEEQILRIRCWLSEKIALGEFGASAIRQELIERRGGGTTSVPSVRTIGRILLRRGVLDGRHRVRRPPPPKGWFLPLAADRKAEVDSFDVIEDLKLRGVGFINVLTIISLHGGLCAAWPRTQITAKNVVVSMIEHWRAHGCPHYAKFDNDTIFQGAHQWKDSCGRVVRICLSLGVTPVFAPPRETGFQAEIESFNGRWQAKVWRRFRFKNLDEVVAHSESFITANHERSAPRIEAAPRRKAIPAQWQEDLQKPLRGKVIFIRRTDQNGIISVLGHTYSVSDSWTHRLVRAEVDLNAHRIRIYALRRREPAHQKL